jgi:hypothetical protein
MARHTHSCFSTSCQARENQTVEVDQAVVQQQGLVGLDDRCLSTGPAVPLIAVAVRNGAAQLVGGRAEPTGRVAPQLRTIGIGEQLAGLGRGGHHQRLRHIEAGHAGIGQDQFRQAEGMDGREYETVTVVDAEPI